jgi:DNA-binding NarL/FixJ family response regulator
MKLRLLLADDHKLFRDGLRSMLEGQKSIEIVAEASDGQSAVKLAGELLPDVILMDVSMQDLNGIEACRKIVADHPSIKIIMLSMHSDRRYITEALRSGARGYLLKDSTFEEVIAAIRDCTSDKIYLSSRIADIVINDYINLAKSADSSAYTVLSAREREVLQMLAEGKTTKEIASQLQVSTKTIESHRKQVMDKLDLHSIAELTKYAIREGLTQLG